MVSTPFEKYAQVNFEWFSFPFKQGVPKIPTKYVCETTHPVMVTDRIIEKKIPLQHARVLTAAGFSIINYCVGGCTGFNRQ